MFSIYYTVCIVFLVVINCKDVNKWTDEGEKSGPVSVCFNASESDVGIYFDHRPPLNIPEDADRIYNINAGMYMIKPVVAFVCEEGSHHPIKEDHKMYDGKIPLYFEVESVPADPSTVDTYDGQLCQKAVNDVPIWHISRFDPAVQTFECGHPGRSTGRYPRLNRSLKVMGNMMVAQGLMHTTPSSTSRMFGFELIFEDGTKATAYSNPFIIDRPVQGIRWITNNFTNISTNNDFSATVEIIDDNGSRIESGFGSTLMVELTIAHEHKVFYKTGSKAGFLNRTQAVLASNDIIISKRTNDKILQQRARKGVATFVLRIEDVKERSFRLNATLLMPGGSWSRVPDDYSDLKCIKEWPVDSLSSHNHDKIFHEDVSFYTYVKNCQYASTAVGLSQEIELKEQKAKSLKLYTTYGKTRKATFNANFPIPGITYEIVDNNGRGIFVGPDSDLEIIVTTKPEGIKFHYDSDSYIKDGKGTFRGSITQVVDDVQLCFTVQLSDSDEIIEPICTESFKVDGNIYLAVFGQFKHTGVISHADPLIETFARFAVEDINDRLGEEMLREFLPVFPRNRKFIIESFDTKLNLYTTTAKYKKLATRAQRDPSKSVRCVIGFMSGVITRDIYPMTAVNKVFIVGVLEQSSDIGTEYFIRLSITDGLLYDLLARFFLDRGWKIINIMRSEYSELSQTFFDVMKKNGIEISSDNFFANIPEQNWTDTLYYSMLSRLKQSKSRIIFCFLRSPMQFFVIRQAIEIGISSMHGFQWVFTGIPATEFPASNDHPLCRKPPTCTEAMAGTILIHDTHALDYTTDLWQHVHQKFFEMDRTLYRGIPRVYPYHFASKYARGYDAVLLYAKMLNHSIWKNETVSETESIDRIKNVYFKGLTGIVDLQNGERKKMVASLVSIRPGPSVHSDQIITAQICRNISFGTLPNGTKILVEVLQQSEYEMILEDAEVGILTLPKTNFKQKRHFYSRVGIIARNTQQLILPPNSSNIPFPIVSVVESLTSRSVRDQLKDPKTLVIREETVVMSFYCERGCGGQLVNNLDKNNYTNGVCVRFNECRCKTVKEVMPHVPEEYWPNKAYSGGTCEEAVCQRCFNGTCASPELCLCYQGYQGSDCSEAVCDGGCGVGECVSPNVCKCTGGMVGRHCSIILISLVGPSILIVIILLWYCFNFYRNWRQKTEWHKLMTSTDWLVNWNDVTPFWRQQSLISVSVSPVSGRSVISGKQVLSAGSLAESTMKNLVLWRNQNCYLQRSHCESIDLSVISVRMEIVTLSRLKHPNIVSLIGVCLEYPHVGVLTEFFPKGSLEDVIASRKLPLDWDVKFSMLKDIARGMEYLHSSLGPHGRLKTSTCLMDNRWTVRITAFGVPTLRKASKLEDEMINPVKLLWTAPELLRKEDSTDTEGTKAGDVYSFGIIISDLCNEDQPYAFERNVLSAEEIILLLKSIDDPANRGLRTTWIKFGGGNPFDPIRPSVHGSHLPFNQRERDGIIQLMRQCWNENPGVRPIFTEVLAQLNAIKVDKGDLVDTLLHRLEEYSTRLEEKFVDASRELQMEKSRLEELLGRLLPRKIVEDMIFGKKVEAEQFEMVTVCFSDISDFVSMTKAMSPFEVIYLLNSLYKCFDTIIDNFDVYKVETVRDEYMVVSGLPVRNGYLHASEIASLALHLMAAIVEFDAQLSTFKGLLMLRIGIHSGPCVAGVVGLQMPRYCLFGDTINVASRMKTNSLALQIHMSDVTANILKMVGGFQTEYRGERDVKGRGRMKTYWLRGADNFHKPLPNPKLAVSAELQQFK